MCQTQMLLDHRNYSVQSVKGIRSKRLLNYGGFYQRVRDFDKLMLLRIW